MDTPQINATQLSGQPAAIVGQKWAGRKKRKIAWARPRKYVNGGPNASNSTMPGCARGPM